MSWAAVAVVGGSLAGSVISSHAATSAADTQASAEQQAAQAQMQMYQQTRGDLQPWMSAGQMGMQQLSQFMGQNPDGSTNPNAPGLAQFTPQAFLANQDPSYGFIKSEANTGVVDQATATGGLEGGSTLRALSSLDANLASQDYGAAWSRFMTTQGQQYQQLMGVAGLGENAAAGVGNLGAQAAGNYGNAITSGAAANAAGIVGSANAYTGGINNAFNAYMMSQMFKGGAGGVAPPNLSGPPTSGVGIG